MNAPSLVAYCHQVCLCFALSFYYTAIPHIKCYSLVNISFQLPDQNSPVLTLYTKKNIATAHTLLYSTVHAPPL